MLTIHCRYMAVRVSPAARSVLVERNQATINTMQNIYTLRKAVPEATTSASPPTQESSLGASTAPTTAVTMARVRARYRA